MELIRSSRLLRSLLETFLCCVIINSTLLNVVRSQQFPSYFETCHKEDTANFNSCVEKSISSIIRHIANGSAELQLPALDPLEIPYLEIREGIEDKDVYLELTFKHTRLMGLSKANITDVRPNFVDKKLEIVCKYQYLDFVGEFISDGAVLSLPLSASGGYSVNMSDVTAIWIIHFDRLELNGTSILSIDEMDLEFIPASIVYDFGDVLDGDNSLGRAVHQFMNKNSHEIFTAMKSKIKSLLLDMCVDIGNHFLANFPSLQLLPE